MNVVTIYSLEEHFKFNGVFLWYNVPVFSGQLVTLSPYSCGTPPVTSIVCRDCVFYKIGFGRCVGKSPNRFFSTSLSREYLSSGENLAGWADCVGRVDGAVFYKTKPVVKYMHNNGSDQCILVLVSTTEIPAPQLG